MGKAVGLEGGEGGKRGEGGGVERGVSKWGRGWTGGGGEGGKEKLEVGGGKGRVEGKIMKQRKKENNK